MTPRNANILDDPTLERMNDSLSGVYNDWLSTIESASNPPVFIVGAPRSGTTLLSQLLSNGSDIGFVNNLTAQFWKVPALAMAFQLQAGGPATSHNLTSDFGRTAAMEDPSEFGFFWRRWFAYGDSHAVTQEYLDGIDDIQMRQEIEAMSAISGSSVMFKNLAACGMNARYLSKVFPRALFLLVDRNPQDVARSLLSARQTILGDMEKWFSVRPPGFETRGAMSPVDEVFWQIETILAHVQAELIDHDPNRLRSVSFDDMVSSPDQLIAAIVGWMQCNEANVAIKSNQSQACTKAEARTPRSLGFAVEAAIAARPQFSSLLSVDQNPFKKMLVASL